MEKKKKKRKKGRKQDLVFSSLNNEITTKKGKKHPEVRRKLRDGIQFIITVEVQVRGSTMSSTLLKRVEGNADFKTLSIAVKMKYKTMWPLQRS